jgi:hypothetical protein
MNTVIYIDEEPRARDLLSRRLIRAVGTDIEVRAIEPERTLDAMMERIQAADNLVSVIVDQKLTAAGTADYVGTELVAKIRMIDSMLPLYILTNYADDINAYLPDIEYVLSKDDLQDEEKLNAIGIRIRRHVNVFQQITGKRELRFEQLLRKGFEAELTAEENSEFGELKYQRERKNVASHLFENDHLKQKMSAAEAMLTNIENLLKK